jgi:GAF domain-containing protein
VTGRAERAGPAPTRAAPDELGRLLLTEHTSSSVLQLVVELVQQALPGAADVSLTLLRNERPATAASTGPLASDLDQIQYASGYGPCLEAAFSGEVSEITDASTDDRWPRCLPPLVSRGVLSVLAAPVPAPHLNAGLNVYGRRADAFTDGDRSALAEFAAYAAAVLTNMDALEDARELAANLQKAMEFRAVIDQAKGILMERYKLTADQAFRLLADASMQRNRKVRELAEKLVLTGALPGAPTTPDHRRPAAESRPPAPVDPGRSPRSPGRNR